MKKTWLCEFWIAFSFSYSTSNTFCYWNITRSTINCRTSSFLYHFYFNAKRIDFKWLGQSNIYKLDDYEQWKEPFTKGCFCWMYLQEFALHIWKAYLFQWIHQRSLFYTNWINWRWSFFFFNIEVFFCFCCIILMHDMQCKICWHFAI